MSVVGLWASTMVLIVYNTLHHQLPACTIPTPGSGIEINCGKVLSSPYSMIFGVPLEVFAVAYFIVNLALIYLVGFGTEKIYRTAFKTLFVWRFLGICLVPYLVVVELLPSEGHLPLLHHDAHRYNHRLWNHQLLPLLQEGSSRIRFNTRPGQQIALTTLRLRIRSCNHLVPCLDRMEPSRCTGRLRVLRM